MPAQSESKMTLEAPVAPSKSKNAQRPSNSRSSRRKKPTELEKQMALVQQLFERNGLNYEQWLFEQHSRALMSALPSLLEELKGEDE